MDSEIADVSMEDEGPAMDTLCRVCACFSELLIPIFEGEGLENNLPDKLRQHLPVKVHKEDHLPPKICYQCASTVLSWHDLVANCTNADQKLRGIFKVDSNSFENASTKDEFDQDEPGESFSSEIFGLGNDLEDSSLNLNSSKRSLQGSPLLPKSEELDETSAPSEVTSPERFIDLTEDSSEMLRGAKEENTRVTCQFQPQIDHSYTRDPSTNPSAPLKAVNPESPRSLQFRSILPRPPQTNISSHVSPKTSVTIKSSVIVAKEKNARSPPILLYYSKGQENIEGTSRKAVLLPLKTVRQAVAQKPTKKKFKASMVHQIPVPKSQIFVPKLISPQTTRLNESVSITPVNKSVDKPVILKALDVKPSVTIMPVSRKPSCNRAVMKSILSNDKAVRYPCSVCGIEFVHQVVRRIHMFRSHNIKPYECSVCKNLFGMMSELKAHMRDKHASEKRTGVAEQLKYACNMCDTSYLWYRDLLRHKREKHQGPVSRSVNKQEKKVVAGVEVSEKEKEMLSSFRTLIDGIEWYHCKECMKSWKSRDKAILHIRTHTKERMYACETCDQKFNTPGVLRRHIQVHGGKKPFQCDYCDKSFSSKQNRDDHHRFHTKEVKTVCESCGEFLTSASMLYYHRKIHSGVNPYVCPYCKKAYAIRALLKRHIRFHTGEKPHLCSVCGRGFFTSGQLRGHSLVHTDDRPFSCDKCGTKMKSTKYLNRHKAICQTSRKK